MANCTITLTQNRTGLSGEVEFEPFPNQIINGVAISMQPTVATWTGSAFTAALIQGGKYRVKAKRHAFHNSVIEVPADSAADLVDLLDGLRTA